MQLAGLARKKCYLIRHVVHDLNVEREICRCAEIDQCSVSAVAPSIEKLATCAVVLVSISILRVIVAQIIINGLKR